jgi:acetaldehyde dehydrogenase (acetylating)
MSTKKKLAVAVLGTGNIGTDLLIKVLRSPLLECKLFAGRNLSSPGTVDLTPAQIGRMCVPAVNLEDCLDAPNVSMITCGGQASIPLACAIARANPGVEYFETVSSIASRSAGPATRINLDEYLMTTEEGLKSFSKCLRAKAILILNPAIPCIHMQTAVLARIGDIDLAKTRETVAAMIGKIQEYAPGYQLVLEPMAEGGRLAAMVRVGGSGDHLPRYAGNLDIINCAAVAFAEAYARRHRSIPCRTN